MITKTPIQAPPLGVNARQVITKRYSQRDDQGNPTEDWADIVTRVVSHVAGAEKQSGTREQFTELMTGIMLRREFIPNTPCLVNAGKQNPQLAACFVLGIEDSIDGIMRAAWNSASVHKTGGGTGFDLGSIRPSGALVRSTHGLASGPVSFLQILNTVTETIKQGGVRRGANMAMLAVAHPDILRFIHAKNDQNSFTNFNISVTVSDRFLEASDRGEWFQCEFDDTIWGAPIHDPVTNAPYVVYRRPTGETVTLRDRAAFLETDTTDCTVEEPPQPGMIYAPDIWNRIVASAHKYAEPGICFIDEVNRHNYLMASMGPIRTSNPCGEEMLHSSNACNLGSIDLAKFYTRAGDRQDPEECIDWDRLREVTHWSTRFLDNVIDTCAWPLPEIDEVVKRTRPVGLGIMGFADLCLNLRITYGSPASIKLMDQVLGFVRRESWLQSLSLGAEKGAFPELEFNRPAYEEFFYDRLGISRDIPLTPRNYEVTTCAPTGTISLVAETSSGIEPNFSFAYVRRDTLGTRTYVHPLAAQALGMNVDESDQASIDRAAAYVVEHEDELPAHFITATAIKATQHVEVLAAAQRNVDNSVSKTCNGAEDDTVESVETLYQLARRLGCKAVCYYREGSREGQVLTAIKSTTATAAAAAAAAANPSEMRESREVTATAQPAMATAPGESGIAQRIERPRELQGWSWKNSFDNANLFVTVNHDGEEIMEVFATGPISGGVGLLASKMLRGGFRPDEVANSLNKVTGTHAVWFNERLLTSPEQTVAECIRITLRRLSGQPDSSHTPSPPQGPHLAVDNTRTKSVKAIARASTLTDSTRTQGRRLITAGQCPDCGDPLIPNGNCPYCKNCSFSRCS